MSITLHGAFSRSHDVERIYHQERSVLYIKVSRHSIPALAVTIVLQNVPGCADLVRFSMGFSPSTVMTFYLLCMSLGHKDNSYKSYRQRVYPVSFVI